MIEKKFEEITNSDLNTERYRRARKFTNTILTLVRDFIPPDHRCIKIFEYKMMKLAWEEDIAIINVRPEWDQLTNAQLALAMLETHPGLSFVNKKEII
jgi:hypothetical protein